MMRALLIVPVVAVCVAASASTAVPADRAMSDTGGRPRAMEPRRVPVAARTIERGEILAVGDVVLEEREVARGLAIDTNVSAGWTARRLIRAGEILRQPAVQPPMAVVVNSPIQVIWTDGGVTISLRGVALRTGAVGDQVGVRLSDGRRLDAIISGPGRAILK